MADEDDEIPPLEDMSEVLQQAEALRGMTLQNVSIKPEKERETINIKASDRKTEETKQPNADDQKSKTATATSQKQETPTYGGMKKGFLFSSGSKPKQKSQAKQTVTTKTKDDIPLIKPKEPADNTSKVQPIPEVQEALRSSAPLLQNKEWINDDLLKKIEKNPDLLRKLTNPSFSQALSKFQTNPTMAAEEYANNPEIQKFFSEFCSILGDHFNNLADKQPQSSQQASQFRPGEVRTHDTSGGADMKEHTNQPQPSADDMKQMQDILSQPDIQSVLQDTRIQKLIELLRTKPEEAQRLIDKADSDLKLKIKKLVDVGLLAFSR
ncbi:uncharacterized protein LOC144432939 [Glandiceps talaboti]